MTDPRWDELSPLLREALDRPEAERDAFLDRACEGRPELREELARLLRLEAASSSFLRPPSVLLSRLHPTSIHSRGGPGGELPVPEQVQPGRKLGPFVLRRFLARGGMGQVWVAEDLELRREVALKLVLPERVDERGLALFTREARAGGRVQHPNLVATLAHGNDGGLAWIAQELVPGSWTLKDSLDALRAEGAVPRDYYRQVAELVARIADGMQAAHDAGVVHRDLKPQNILVTEDDQPKVTDFGLARVSEDSYQSHSGDFAGTWAYMSPEQVTAKRMGLDHRTDVFSLGIVLYELLTLRRPFDGDTTHQIAQNILYVDPPDASQVRSQCPRELAVICGKALEKLPGNRYATMAELAADLRRHLADEPIHAQPPGLATRGLKWVRRHPAISSTSALGLVALVVVSLLSLDLAHRTDELAEANHSLEAETRRAQEQEQLATRRADDVLALSATKDLEDLVAEADTLWPAHPEMLPRYERWLEDARLLLEGRPADEHAGTKARPGLEAHRAKLAELMAGAVDETDPVLLEQARGHGSFPELERLRAELLWRRRMLGLAEWPDPVEVEAEVAVEDLPTETAGLLDLVRTEVGPAGATGRATRGWVLAGLALDRADDADWPAALMLMAFAQARLGRLDEALATRDSALEEQAALGGDTGALEADGRSLEALVDHWGEAARVEREAELAPLASRVAALEIEVGLRRIEDPEDAWWQRQLAALVAGIEDLHDPRAGLAGDTLAEPFGWGIARRAAFARSVAERSVEGMEAAARWSEAVAAIEASPSYGGLVLTPHVGLLPLGPDPDSGLWEFAHLATGEPAQRDSDGRLRPDETTGIVLVLLPGGTFWMGAQRHDPEGPNHDPDADPFQGPVHEVTLSPHFVSKYEMTQAQWLRATAASPSQYRLSDFAPTLLHPVESVSWDECMEVLGRLDLELPTEAQWEYACRGGTTTPWWLGSERESIRGKVNIADRTAARAGAPWPVIADWPDNEDGGIVHREIGAYPPNPFGLHEVHGNVWEWCRDGYVQQVYPPTPRTDPLVPWEGLDVRSTRGGSFYGPALVTRSAYRDSGPPGGRAMSQGVRPARRVGP